MAYLFGFEHIRAFNFFPFQISVFLVKFVLAKGDLLLNSSVFAKNIQLVPCYCIRGVFFF